MRQATAPITNLSKVQCCNTKTRHVLVQQAKLVAILQGILSDDLRCWWWHLCEWIYNMCRRIGTCWFRVNSSVWKWWTNTWESTPSKAISVFRLYSCRRLVVDGQCMCSTCVWFGADKPSAFEKSHHGSVRKMSKVCLWKAVPSKPVLHAFINDWMLPITIGST